ncbi:hypothetical protein GGF41_005471, partial [Coemansia sp. RSA 2531]
MTGTNATLIAYITKPNDDEIIPFEFKEGALVSEIRELMKLCDECRNEKLGFSEIRKLTSECKGCLEMQNQGFELTYRKVGDYFQTEHTTCDDCPIVDYNK